MTPSTEKTNTVRHLSAPTNVLNIISYLKGVKSRF